MYDHDYKIPSAEFTGGRVLATHVAHNLKTSRGNSIKKGANKRTKLTKILRQRHQRGRGSNIIALSSYANYGFATQTTIHITDRNIGPPDPI